MKSGKEIFDQANRLQKSRNFSGAIKLYTELLENNSYEEFEVLVQLGGTYYFNKSFKEAYDCYKKGLDINSNEEIASLGFYLACSKTDNLEEGLFEMKRYLDNHSPQMYNDTIDELMDGLKNGYATDYKQIILEIVEKRMPPNDERL